jgi:hypothetical protein
MAYKAKVVKSTKEISVREKIRLKNFSDFIQLDEATELEPVLIDIDYVATVHVENDKSDNTEYDKQVYIDKNGQGYVSGSETLFRQFEDIYDEMSDEGLEDEITIKVYKSPSKNYKGKSFLTCNLV